MLQLTFHDEADSPADTLELSDFRVTGGVLWDHLEHGLIASYYGGRTWVRRGQCYRRVVVTGGSCLLFGTARDPFLLSTRVERIVFEGTTLYGDEIPIAQYNDHQDMWQGLKRPLWWIAMRVISEMTLPALVDMSHIVRVNPREPGAAVGTSALDFTAARKH